MDYGAIVKEAWRVTWRYKVLWIFGLLSGAASSGGGGGGGSRGYVSDTSDFDPATSDLPPELIKAGEQAVQWMTDNLVLLIALAVFAVLVGIILWVVSIAARGGLIHLVSEAEDRRDVRARDGWSAGFGRWFGLFAVRFLLYLPLVLLVIVLVVVTVLPVVAISSSGGSEPAAAAGVLGTCGVLALLGLVLVVVGFVISLVAEFAERRVMLDGQGTLAAISAGWGDLRSNFKDVIVMWLITLVIGFAYAAATLVVLVIFGGGAVVAFFAAGLFGGVLVGLLALIALMVPSAVYATFVSSLWTIFWREMTGRGTLGARRAVEAPAPAEFIPAPPVPPAPPTPPAG